MQSCLGPIKRRAVEGEALDLLKGTCRSNNIALKALLPPCGDTRAEATVAVEQHRDHACRTVKLLVKTESSVRDQTSLEAGVR